jgi:hypothetical protein
MTIRGYAQMRRPEQGGGKAVAQDVLGIYKLDGDRLTIACRKDGPRPEKFESLPSSGVTLLELERTKPPAHPAPDKPEAAESEAPPRTPKQLPSSDGGNPSAVSAAADETAIHLLLQSRHAIRSDGRRRFAPPCTAARRR